MEKLLSLRGKMLIFTFGIVAVLVGLSLTVIRSFVADQVQRQVGVDLERTHSVFLAFMQERADGCALSARWWPATLVSSPPLI